MARWDQMTVARRQRAKQERKDDEEWLKITRVTEAQVHAKAAEVGATVAATQTCSSQLTAQAQEAEAAAVRELRRRGGVQRSSVVPEVAAAPPPGSPQRRVGGTHPRAAAPTEA